MVTTEVYYSDRTEDHKIFVLEYFNLRSHAGTKRLISFHCILCVFCRFERMQRSTHNAPLEKHTSHDHNSASQAIVIKQHCCKGWPNENSNTVTSEIHSNCKGFVFVKVFIDRDHTSDDYTTVSNTSQQSMYNNECVSVLGKASGNVSSSCYQSLNQP